MVRQEKSSSAAETANADLAAVTSTLVAVVANDGSSRVFAKSRPTVSVGPVKHSPIVSN